MSKKGNLFKFLLLIIGLVIFIYIFRRVGFINFFSNLKQANPLYIFISFLFVLITFSIRSFKWKYILGNIMLKERKIKTQNFFKFYLINALFGVLTPMRVGELGTPLILKKKWKVPYSSAYATIVLDRFFELSAILVLVVLSFLINANIRNILNPAVFSLIVLFLLIFIILIFILFFSPRNTILGFLKKLAKITKIKFLKKAEKGFANFYINLKKVNLKKHGPTLFLISIAAFLSEGLLYYFAFYSILRLPFLLIVTSQFIGAGIAIISMIPVGLGIADFSVIHIINSSVNNYAQVATPALFARLFMLFFMIVFGIICLVIPTKIKNKK